MQNFSSIFPSLDIIAEKVACFRDVFLNLQIRELKCYILWLYKATLQIYFPTQGRAKKNIKHLIA